VTAILKERTVEDKSCKRELIDKTTPEREGGGTAPPPLQTLPRGSFRHSVPTPPLYELLGLLVKRCKRAPRLSLVHTTTVLTPPNYTDSYFSTDGKLILFSYNSLHNGVTG